MGRRRISWAARAVVVGAVMAFGMPAAGAASDRLPDLGMARLTDVKIDSKSRPGRQLLRFSTVIVNVGSGPFEVHAQRPNTTTDWTVSQRIRDDVGGSRYVPTSAGMVFDAGDGHSHWHLRDLESADLVRLDNGTKVGTFAKFGYCFWDNAAYRLTLPNAPAAPVYTHTGCGASSSLSLDSGLSVGWGDKYPASLPNQYIDITGLTAGNYRLVVTANALGQFTERDATNNQTWVDLKIRARGALKIVGYGPAA